MFRQVEHTADVALEVEAPSSEELFVEALRAVTDCLTDVRTVGGDRQRRIRAAAPAIDLLLVEWLGELLYAFETERELYREATVELRHEAEEVRLEAVVRGERWDPRRHPTRLAIKGVTYHGLRVERRRGRWWARVVLDV